MNLHAMKPFLVPVLLIASSAAYGSSSWLRIDATPFDSGRFTFETSVSHESHGLTRFVVEIHLKNAPWPKRMGCQLSKLTISKSTIEDIPKRPLRMSGDGLDRRVEFRATRSELSRLTFEYSYDGESNGIPMPSLSAFYFRLSKPPKRHPNGP